MISVSDTLDILKNIPQVTLLRRKKDFEPKRKSKARMKFEAITTDLRTWLKEKNRQADEEENAIKWNSLVGGDLFPTAQTTLLYGIALSILWVDCLMTYPLIQVLIDMYTIHIAGKHWTDSVIYYMPLFRWAFTVAGVIGMVFFVRNWLIVGEGPEGHIDAEEIKARVKDILTHEKDCEGE